MHEVLLNELLDILMTLMTFTRVPLPVFLLSFNAKSLFFGFFLFTFKAFVNYMLVFLWHKFQETKFPSFLFFIQDIV